MKVCVVGGGPAGMMAAIHAKELGHDVTLFEKMNMLGKKLLITGKGRCNITCSLPIEKFIENTPGNGVFLYSAFHQYTNKDILSFLRQEGLEVKEERGNRIFPITDKSQDVLQCFQKRLQELHITIQLNSKVEELVVKDNVITGVKVNGKNIPADAVILATGGKSYPATGSTGDGYYLAQKLGHTVTKIAPSLVPLEIKEKSICQQLQGLSLKNVQIQIVDKEKKKCIYEDFGEMLFTHFGVSGPIILSSSAHLLRYPSIEEKLSRGSLQLIIDLKPALTVEKLNVRILRDFEALKNKEFKNSLNGLLPHKLVPIIIEKTQISKEKQVNSITKEERQKLVQTLKQFTLTISGFRPIEEAIITAGGVSIKEINPKTMESKRVQNLYFAGEVMDVDAYTGGFNLQIAYSTGYVAGKVGNEG